MNIDQQSVEGVNRVLLLPKKAFIALVAVGLLLRLIVLPASGFQTDIVMWQNWALKIRHLDIGHAYDPVAFLEGTRVPLLLVDHPPVNLYYLTFIAGLPFNAPYLHPAFNALVKSPGVVFDCIVLLLLVAIARSLRYQESSTRFVALLYWLNPGFIYHHAFWGLNESMSAAVFLSVLLLLIHRRSVLALIALIASFALKFQMIIFLPIVSLFALLHPAVEWVYTGSLLRDAIHRVWRRVPGLLVGFVGGLLILVYLYIPFIASGTWKDALAVFSGSVGRFPNLTQGAYNAWFMIDGLTGFSISDTVQVFGIITPRTIGILLFGIATLANIVVLVKSCINNYRLPTPMPFGVRGSDQGVGVANSQLLIVSFALQGYSFFMLPTEMHERYLFYALTFIPLIAWKSVRLYGFYGLMSFVYLANLVLVYNYFHLDWPQMTLGHYIIPILNVLCYGYLWREYIREGKKGIDKEGKIWA